jgi:hypothetical protein
VGGWFIAASTCVAECLQRFFDALNFGQSLVYDADFGVNKLLNVMTRLFVFSDFQL